MKLDKHSITQNVQHVIHDDRTGIATGTGTAGYAFLTDVATVAEKVGVIAGCLLTLFILGCKVWDRFFKKNDTNGK